MSDKTRDQEDTGSKPCTWNDDSDCSSCPNQETLHCKWDRTILMGFQCIAWPFLVVGIFGLVLTGLVSGVWWPLISYVSFLIVFLTVFEIRILCSHCPFYAEEGATLRCLANHGMPKLWRYRPGPMAPWEKTALKICFSFYGLFPLAGQAYGAWFVAARYSAFGLVALMGVIGIALGTLVTMMSFFWLLKNFYCAKCVNFSCPLNTVPKNAVDDFLRRSPGMRDAWEKAGYSLCHLAEDATGQREHGLGTLVDCDNQPPCATACLSSSADQQ